jgi:hypothetical protein
MLRRVQIVQVPAEYSARLEGATHACRHIADKLNGGAAVLLGRDFNGKVESGSWAATCGVCAEYLDNFAPRS